MALFVGEYTGLDLAQTLVAAEYRPIVSALYWGILKGNGTTLEDLYLKISSFQVNLRGGYTTTPDSLSMVVPGLDIPSNDINARKAYDIELWAKFITDDGTEVTQKITDANFDGFTYNRGGIKASRTFSGSRTRTYNTSNPWTLTEVISKEGDFSDANARKSFVVGTKYHVNIVPGDVLTFEGESLTVDLVNMAAGKNNEQITFTEVEG